MPFSPSHIYTQVPSDFIPFLLEKVAAEGRPLLFVAEGEKEMHACAELLGFLEPSLEVLKFPGWDCLPYDRVSPSSDILAERVRTLCMWADRSLSAEKTPKKSLLLTTPYAFLQKVPPPSAFAHKQRTLSPGMDVLFEDFIDFLSRQGYHRVETVRESNEVAVRGGLIDFFPSHQQSPLRLEWEGDTLETLHTFDPFTQRRQDLLPHVTLFPSSEIPFGLPEQNRFKQRYRELFGVPHSTDRLYQSVSEGILPKGIEHWLPLFYDEMVSLRDFLKNPPLYITSSFFTQVRERCEEIQDYYARRLTFQKTKGEAPYNPLPPQRLYETETDINTILSSAEVIEISPFALPEGTTQGRVTNGGISPLPFPSLNGTLAPLKAFLSHHKKKKILVGASSLGSCDRLETMFKDNGLDSCLTYQTFKQALQGPRSFISLSPFPLERGFITPDFVLLSEHDLLGDRLHQKPRKTKRTDLFLAEVSTMATGDFLVHEAHGIGRYEGIQTLTINDAPHECLLLVYEGNDKLFIPVENLNVLKRYGQRGTDVKLDKLGSTAWQTRKAKAKKNLLELANFLLKTAAARQYHPVDPLPSFIEQYEAFCLRFPHRETEDQLQATEDVLKDLQSGEAMDRLICGDVGFGKTEVALRAAFAVAQTGKQVAVVTPTTLLCRQHFERFSERLTEFGLRVDHLSRFTRPSQVKQIRDDLEKGTIRVIIGTHTLLSERLKFADLGLVIVDEEQHFGVKQKEKLKSLKTDVHVLTLTATPIPRTLQMALSGVRSMSLIATPPVDRLAIRTFVLPYDRLTLREALMREHHRGGQSFYVSPRLADLQDIHKNLMDLVPELKVAIAHGQMSPRDLERVMETFYQGQYDILLATNIIESGIDIANANTLIVHRADLWGLSQLYQLRGRIGRSKVRAYAYLTLPPSHPVSKEAQKRLEVIQTLDSLGAGFQLASYDLDLRGAGNILGEQQSGHIKEIGVELYQQLLQEAIEEKQAQRLKTPKKETPWVPTLSLGIPVLIPNTYVPDFSVKLELYRRLSSIETEEDIQDFREEFIDRFGPLPTEVHNLMEIVDLKCLCRRAHVEKVDLGPKGFVLTFHKNTFPNPERLLTYIYQNPNRLEITPHQSLVFMETLTTPEEKIEGVRRALQKLIGLCQEAPNL